MKKECPLLYNLFIKEIFKDVNGIIEIGLPDNRCDDFIIYKQDETSEWCPKNEINGWLFDDNIILDVECLTCTENKLK